MRKNYVTICRIVAERGSVVQPKKKELAIENVLLAGKIMMESNAETYRVEDTMRRMAVAQGLVDADTFVTTTGIIFSPGRLSYTQLVRIEDRSTDLEKVALVNDISRRLVEGKYNARQANQLLHKLEYSNLAFPLWGEMIAAAVASGSFLLLFGGTFEEIPVAMLAGFIGHGVAEVLEGYSKVQFVGEFVAALIVALTVAFFFNLGVVPSLDKIILGGIMPLVPGVLITNSVRDLMSGHFVSGVSKGAEAILTSFALGAGVAIVLSIM